MIHVQSRWILKTSDLAAEENLSRELSISPLLAKLLVLRGIKEKEKAQEFLTLSDLEKVKSSHLLSGVNDLTKRVHEAVQKKEKIVIYGDYDVDGICSVVILMECLSFLGADVSYRIPDRFQEGYGLNEQAIQELASENTRLIITVDCGITSCEEAKLCQRLGIDIIVTDHHNPGNELPDAFIIVNPKLDDSEDQKNLAGAGVALKVALALTKDKLPDSLLREWIILASLATVADVVPLIGENRIIVKNGLKFMSETKRIGLQQLLQAEGLFQKNVTADKLAFQISPKLNSAGRLETADISIQMLLSQNAEETKELVSHLTQLNERRRQIEEEMLQQVYTSIKTNPKLLDRPLLLVEGENWNQGVIGILASRLVAEYHKPTVVISWQDGIGKGSGRSLEGVSLYDILKAGKDELLHFGGHKMAAGLTVKKENFSDFVREIMEKADEVLKGSPTENIMYVDAEVTPAQLLKEGETLLESLEPMGEGNPAPVFLLRGVDADFYRRIGKKQEHLLCRIGKLDGIAFRQAEQIGKEQNICLQDLIGSLSENEYMGVKKLQFMIQEFQPTGEYYKRTGQIPSGFSNRIQEITQLLLQNQPVVLLYDDVRSLGKHSKSLRFYFKDLSFQMIHGELERYDRQKAEISLKRGERKIFLITYAALKKWCEFYSFPKELSRIYRCWNRPRKEEKGLFPDSVQLFRWEEENTGTFRSVTDGSEVVSPNLGVIYINRPSTEKKTKERFPEGITELKRNMRERMLIRKIWKENEGVLLTDGIPFEPEGKELFSGWLELADVPYTFSEIDFWLKTSENNGMKLFYTFSEKEVQQAKKDLEHMYPEESALFLDMKCFLLENLQTDRLYSILDEEFVEQFRKYTGKDWTRLECEGILRIFYDLGLCEYRKKGSIMTIKLLELFYFSQEWEKEASLFFWEGRERKASFQYCLQKMEGRIQEKKTK